MIWQAIAPLGREAENPFYFDKVYLNVYSIEELCYVLFENAFLIDNDIVSKDLADWIYKECGLSDLANSLYTLINQRAQAVSFVGTILDYAGYYTKEEVEKAESILRLNVSMSVFEKWKAKADFLYENRHYNLAIREYERVLETLNESETVLKSRILNNMGVTYMALYLTDKAAECFKRAYAENGNEEAFRNYVAAMRIKLPENEYIRFAATDDMVAKAGILVETEFKEAGEAFESTERARSMKDAFSLKEKGNSTLYYEEVARMIERVKSDYREVVLENDQ